jgi:hypothetical protein
MGLITYIFVQPPFFYPIWNFNTLDIAKYILSSVRFCDPISTLTHICDSLNCETLSPLPYQVNDHYWAIKLILSELDQCIAIRTTTHVTLTPHIHPKL